MGWADEISARQAHAAGEARSEEQRRQAAFSKFEMLLDQTMPEIARGCRDLKLPADFGGGLARKCWTFNVGPSLGATVTSAGKWYWGRTIPSKEQRQRAARHHAWENYSGVTREQLFDELKRQVEEKALRSAETRS